MIRRDRTRLNSRVHAYAASFGEDFASKLIEDFSEERCVVLDPFVGAGTTPLVAVLSNRNAIGIDIDPIACRISRVLTSRFDATYLAAATDSLQVKLRCFQELLALDPSVYDDLGPGGAFRLGSSDFRIPDEPAIAYWFDPSHMAILSIACELVACEPNQLVRQAFEVAISSSIIRKWPNTLSFAMDIDHSRPHKPRDAIPQPIESQFALLYRVLGRVVDTIIGIQEELESFDFSATILEGDSVRQLSTLESDSVGFVLTSPPYLNAIDYPRAHKFSQWWLSPQTAPLGRSEYLGLRQASAKNEDKDCLSLIPALSNSLTPFRDMPVFRNISCYVVDLAAVVDQLHRVARARSRVVFVVADNVLAGIRLPVSEIIEELLRRSGFTSVVITSRNIKNTRRRYPFGANGFAGPMKDEFLVAGVKPF